MRCDGAKACRWCSGRVGALVCNGRAALLLSHPPERSEATPFVCGGTSQRGPSPITGRPGRAGFRAATVRQSRLGLLLAMQTKHRIRWPPTIDMEKLSCIVLEDDFLPRSFLVTR